MRLRVAPDLHFQQDTALDYAMQIARALNQPKWPATWCRSQSRRMTRRERPSRRDHLGGHPPAASPARGKPHAGKSGGHHARNRQRKPKGQPIDGWLIIDKPPGMARTDVVNRLKRAFDAQKSGHGGTLDPLATGVLPIAFGAATKTVPYVMDGTKLYRFTLRFGEARDTDDADGETIGDLGRPARPMPRSRPPCRPSAATSCRSRRSSPPSRSPASAPTTWPAKARRPVLAAPPRPGRPVRAGSSAPTPTPPIFKVHRGKGVYMRTLARDLAKACGTVGHIAALRRLRVGPFMEATAIPLDKLRVPGDTPARFPGPPASGRDRAGRHPGAGPDGSGGHAASRTARPSAWST